MKLLPKLFLAILFLLSSHSCVFYSHIYPPCLDVPNSWRIDTNEMTTTANMRWWEKFDDPVLNCLILEALENNNNLKVAIERVKEYYAQYKIVRSFQFPQLNGTALESRQQASLANGPIPLGEGRITNTYASFLNLAYEVDLWGRIQRETDAALADYFAQIEARRVVVLTLVSSVASSYITLLQFDQQHTIAVDTVRSRLNSYQIAVLRFEGGVSTELEVKQAESEVDVAALRVKQLELAIAQEENLLSILIGKNPGSVCRGPLFENFLQAIKEEEPNSEHSPIYIAWNPHLDVPAGLPSDLLWQRPDLQQAEQVLIAANARIDAARAALFPQISLTSFFGNVSLELHNLFTSQAQTWQYEGSMTQPIFYGWRLVSRVEERTAQAWEALYQYQYAIQNAFREVEDALMGHKISRELFEINLRRVKVLKDYLTLATLQYNNGQTDYLNVLDAERNLFAAQLDYMQTLGDNFNSLVRLYKTLGGGWVIDADEALRGRTRN